MWESVLPFKYAQSQEIRIATTVCAPVRNDALLGSLSPYPSAFCCNLRPVWYDILIENMEAMVWNF